MGISDENAKQNGTVVYGAGTLDRIAGWNRIDKILLILRNFVNPV